MSVITMDEMPIIAAPNFMQRALTRLFDELSADAEDWSRMVTGLRRFEDDKLLDEPTAENLASHRQALEMLIFFGSFIANATKDPAFPNRETHAMVEATLQILRDDMAMWHGSRLAEKQSAEILATCFPA
jgi:hypothetical protein